MTYQRSRLGGMSSSAAIVGRPTVTNPASNVEIIVTQTTVTNTMAVVLFEGVCNAVEAAESLG
jgi:hypothetical protein